jgi:hypothetical protein
LLDHIGANLAPTHGLFLESRALFRVCRFSRQTQALFRFVLVPIRELHPAKLNQRDFRVWSVLLTLFKLTHYRPAA